LHRDVQRRLALEIAVRAAGLSGEVIVPSFTFIATAHALQWQHITPVFCDIDPRTHNIDPVAVEALITPRTTGIVGVHIWGRGCDVTKLTDVARRHKLRLLFDAAHAFGCSYEGTAIGNFGDAEVFSFHSTKWLNSFEGGAVVTNDDDLAGKVRLMGQFGFADYDRVDSIGTNAKMSEVAAAMALTSIESADVFSRDQPAELFSVLRGASEHPRCRRRAIRSVPTGTTISTSFWKLTPARPASRATSC
jgi:dTDP-4-amino-4,6-dideoxygalactose transaminase